METGNVAVTTLRPGDNSAFSFDLFDVQGENVRYYTLFPGGVPAAP